MSEHPIPVSRSSRHGYGPGQGDRSRLSLLRSFDNSSDATNLVTGSCLPAVTRAASTPFGWNPPTGLPTRPPVGGPPILIGVPEETS